MYIERIWEAVMPLWRNVVRLKAEVEKVFRGSDCTEVLGCVGAAERSEDGDLGVNRANGGATLVISTTRREFRVPGVAAGGDPGELGLRYRAD